jgi:S1-C subfamily serine protease
MKLYSKSQLIVVSLSCVLGTALLFAAGLGFFALGEKASAPAAGSRAGSTAPVSAATPAPSAVPVVPAQAQSNGGFSPYSADEQNNINIYDTYSSGVVNITTETVGYNWFMEPVPTGSGIGSGSIIDSRGYVLTNNHVIAGASTITIGLADGHSFPGKVVGTDPENDLAVVKFDPKGEKLRVIPFGSSGTLKVGQKVLAIGNPFGINRTLTTGIVSGLGRAIQQPENNNYVIQNMIQTDASINPGNSGGPLLDTDGRMVGVNAIIAGDSGTSSGVGFAVPVDTVKRVVPQLISTGRVARGRIDASLLDLSRYPQIVSYANLTVDHGLLVQQVKTGGSAEKAGLKGGTQQVRYGFSGQVVYLGGDIITNVDGMQISTASDYYTALEDNKPGDKVKVEILRNGKKMTLTVTLADQQDTAQ